MAPEYRARLVESTALLYAEARRLQDIDPNRAKVYQEVASWNFSYYNREIGSSWVWVERK